MQRKGYYTVSREKETSSISYVTLSNLNATLWFLTNSIVKIYCSMYQHISYYFMQMSESMNE